MKILVVSANAFSKVLNNGKTYEAIFSSFNQEDIAQLFLRPQDGKDIDYDYCKSYYSVSEVDIIKQFLLINKDCGGIVTDTAAIHDNSKIYSTFKNKNGIKYNPLLRDLLWFMGRWKNKKFIHWCHSTDADLVFFVGGGGGYIHRIARYVATLLDVPLATYFTDDYLIYPRYRGIIQKIHHFRMKRFYQKTINQSEMLFCIGDIMANEYTNYFKKQFHPIMNIVDIVPFRINDNQNKIPVVSYFGGLHLNRWEMICRFSKLVKDTVVVKVYTTTELSKEMQSNFTTYGVEYCGSVQGHELHLAMQNSDILLHVESDDPYYRSLTRLSVSTKIPEYLISSRPIIAYGPNEVASLKLLADHKLALVIDPSDLNDLSLESLSTLIENPDKRNILAQQAYKYAVRTFNKREVADKFKEDLKSIIKRHNS